MKKMLAYLSAAALLLGLCACQDAGSGTSPAEADGGSASAYQSEMEKELDYLLVEQLTLDEDGAVLTRQVNEYDGDGRLTTSYSYSGSTLYCTVQYTYEDDPQGVKQTGIYDQSGGTAKTEAILDSAGNQLQYKAFNADGSCYSWGKSEYDEEGRILSELSLAEDGSMKSGYRYTYDSYGNPLIWVIYGSSTSDIVRTLEYRCTYDADGNLTARETFLDGVSIGSMEYTLTYDSGGTIRRAEGIGSDGSTVVTTYDGDGHIAEQVTTQTEGRITDTYDSAGNLLSRKCEMTDSFQWYQYRYTAVEK